MGRFGTILEDHRIRRGYSLSEVQRITKVDRNTLAKMEYGEIVPTLRTLERLSKCYNSDLISIYSTCRIEFNQFLLNIYRRLDQVSSHGEIKGLREIITDLKNFSDNLSDDKRMQLKSQIGALEIWAEFIKLSEPKYQNCRISYTYVIIDYFRQNHKGFSIDSLEKYNFDYFELRLLLTLCSSWMNTDQKNTSIKICDFVLDRLNNDTNQFDVVVDLITRVYYLKSFTYYFMKEDKKTIEYATRGIKLSVQRKYISLLPDLYARRGIAKLLSGMDFKDDIIFACKACEVINENQFLEHMIKTLNTKYEVNVYEFYEPYIGESK
ncbi:MAG: helix-turn-helix transcriptional regulator [Clostridia bacterium]|nr:helix-turn-helix transcriptional regulator [Clostridia bacterium]